MHKPPARLRGDNRGSCSLRNTPVANSPPDIVLGVALAADPEKYRAAVERLRQISAGAGAEASFDPGAFAAAVEKAWPDPANAPPMRPNAAPPPRIASVPVQQGGKAAAAFGQLEAFVLQSFIQSMLPKDAQHVFGKGTAGEVWKSMLAEKLGAEIAKSGRIGIAQRLASAGAAAGHAAIASPKGIAATLPQLPSASVASAFLGAQATTTPDIEKTRIEAPQPSTAAKES